jgi:beta-mannosidase
MVGKLDLGGAWKIKGVDGHRGSPESYCAEVIDERTFIPARVPGEVHLDLLRAGQIEDPRVGTNALRARWVEEECWIYRRTFVAPAEALRAGRAWLVFEGLDLAADIYLNGHRVASHANAFAPCRVDVTRLLREGENQLALTLDAGLHLAAERPSLEYLPDYQGLLHKRMWLRKPQYQFAWDWNPRLINVGIFRPVRLEWCDDVRIDQVTVYSELASDRSRATVHLRLHVENVRPVPLRVRASMRIGGVASGQAAQEFDLPPGCSTQMLSLDIDQPRLWWPRPHGEPHLYRVQAEIEREGHMIAHEERRTGIRSVRINQDPHPVEGQFFTLEVNGIPVFAKGGNWVPADMIYADVDKERYSKLVSLALQANFNMLRIWGGGLYMDHDFLDLCDEAGIMVWHDLIFACSKYPAGDPKFLESVKGEVTYVARELSPHPSLMVWCGNNELEWGTWEWGYDKGRAYPDYALYHHVFPVILKNEDPSRPYWPSSPFSSDHIAPNAPTVGDQHPWHVSIGQNREDFWAYRDDVSRFPNEGGALGASSVRTLRQFLPEHEQYYLSPSWEYHDNEIAIRANGLMNEEWFSHWLGMEPAKMSLEDYAFYSGVLQAEALQEYIYNFRRRMFSTSSAIFWMYNDSWPVTHGWTIVDYYLRRKLSYHPVRRAFDPLQIIPALEDDRVLVYGVNDTLQPWRGEARFGSMRFDGQDRDDRLAQVELAPNAATLIGHLALTGWDESVRRERFVYATLWQGEQPVRQNRLLLARYRDIRWPRPEIKVMREGGYAILRSDVFAWGVCIDPTGEADLPDDVFDLLPGVPLRMPWPESHPLPAVARVANY